MEDKVSASLDLIARHVRASGLNRIYVAYSGGNDSKAVLKLCRSIYPTMMAIHNEHPGESIGHEGILIVKAPKDVCVPIFLRTVDLSIQVDGTRRDEDKTVIFEGAEIHRSEMSGPYTDSGVWNLRVLFPIWDWTDSDVREYLGDDAYRPR